MQEELVFQKYNMRLKLNIGESNEDKLDLIAQAVQLRVDRYIEAMQLEVEQYSMLQYGIKNAFELEFKRAD